MNGSRDPFLCNRVECLSIITSFESFFETSFRHSSNTFQLSRIKLLPEVSIANNSNNFSKLIKDSWIREKVSQIQLRSKFIFFFFLSLGTEGSLHLSIIVTCVVLDDVTVLHSPLTTFLSSFFFFSLPSSSSSSYLVLSGRPPHRIYDTLSRPPPLFLSLFPSFSPHARLLALSGYSLFFCPSIANNSPLPTLRAFMIRWRRREGKLPRDVKWNGRGCNPLAPRGEEESFIGSRESLFGSDRA